VEVKATLQKSVLPKKKKEEIADLKVNVIIVASLVIYRTIARKARTVTKVQIQVERAVIHVDNKVIFQKIVLKEDNKKIMVVLIQIMKIRSAILVVNTDIFQVIVLKEEKVMMDVLSVENLGTKL
jgi:hypothetical protein